MDVLDRGVRDRWSSMHRRPDPNDPNKWRPGPFPGDAALRARELFESLHLIASEPVAQAAFDYLTHVDYWVETQHHRAWQAALACMPGSAASPEEVGLRDRAQQHAAEAAAESRKKLRAVRGAMRSDLGIGGDFELAEWSPSTSYEGQDGDAPVEDEVV